jgi:hypothetical protein
VLRDHRRAAVSRTETGLGLPDDPHAAIATTPLNDASTIIRRFGIDMVVDSHG